MNVASIVNWIYLISVLSKMCLFVFCGRHKALHHLQLSLYGPRHSNARTHVNLLKSTNEHDAMMPASSSTNLTLFLQNSYVHTYVYPILYILCIRATVIHFYMYSDLTSLFDFSLFTRNSQYWLFVIWNY